MFSNVKGEDLKNYSELDVDSSINFSKMSKIGKSKKKLHNDEERRDSIDIRNIKNNFTEKKKKRKASEHFNNSNNRSIMVDRFLNNTPNNRSGSLFRPERGQTSKFSKFKNSSNNNDSRDKNSIEEIKEHEASVLSSPDRKRNGGERDSFDFGESFGKINSEKKEAEKKVIGVIQGDFEDGDSPSIIRRGGTFDVKSKAGGDCNLPYILKKKNLIFFSCHSPKKKRQIEEEVKHVNREKQGQRGGRRKPRF